MDRPSKEKFVEELRHRLKNAKGTFLVDYQGLNVEDLNALRKELRDVNSEFQVVKNRLLKIAVRETDTSVIEDQMRGPSAIAFAHDDVIAPAKALVGFARQHKALKLKSGQISGKPIEPEGIKRLAELPGRDVLLAQVLSAMQAVPSSFVRVLQGTISNLLYALKAIEEKKAA